ncbi:5'-adenylylsulfate reductase-like 7, partial [Genlisea aurea]
SIFSIYGVHSVPSLLIVNQTMKIRYHGRKDLDSLVKFYKRNTGVDPIVDMAEEETSSSETSQNNPPGGASMGYSGEEPYLLLSIVFVSLRAVVFFFPGIASRILALWSACVSNLNVAILRESKQLVGHLLHLIDVGRIWRKVKLTKTRNFQKGAARNARVWASSLTTSVSLGETSQTR